MTLEINDRQADLLIDAIEKAYKNGEYVKSYLKNSGMNAKYIEYEKKQMELETLYQAIGKTTS